MCIRDSLNPNTLYAYRVGDGVNWSEYYHFKTASLEAEPFSFIYFGDAQNEVKTHWSRVFREAFRDAPRAAFTLHAVDLIAQKKFDRMVAWSDRKVVDFPISKGIETYKKVELEDSVEPIISEIFRLYYITPSEAKATITELFTTVGTNGNYIPIQVTEEATTRSIIVRGKEKDLDIVDKVIREIDKRTKQVLIEAFIVEATSTFEQSLGKRLGAAYTRRSLRVGGTQGGSSVGAASGSGAALSDSTGAFTSGAGTDNLVNFGSAAATSGIGILRKTGSAVLKLELDFLEAQGLSKTVSNPKLFTLDNQQASINQGETIYIDGGEGEDKPVDASLKLIVTPNIIGDGNVMLQIQVNNDTPNRANAASVGVNKMEINTKLLVADGDIVVIGGIKKNNVANNRQGVPGTSKVPIIGKVLSGKSNSDTMNELLVFIAPRIL